MREFWEILGKYRILDVEYLGSKGVVTNYGEGGATKREGGAHEVLPLRKGGAEKVFAILKGGGTTSFGVDFTW